MDPRTHAHPVDSSAETISSIPLGYTAGGTHPCRRLEIVKKDLQSESRLKVNRARSTVDDTIELLAEDLLTGTYWLDRRKMQQPARRFGIPTEALWAAFRSTLPMDGGDRSTGSLPIHEIAVSFIRNNPAERFYEETLQEPQ